MSRPYINCIHVANCSEPEEYRLAIQSESVEGKIAETISLCLTCWNAIKMQAVQDIVNEAVQRGMRYGMRHTATHSPHTKP